MRLSVSALAIVLVALDAGAAEIRFIEEVLVTAEYVQKSAQKTPIAVTAIDETFIEDFGVSEVDDLALFVPSLSRDGLDLTIRGIGRNFRSLGGDVGVPIYYNGVYSEEAIAYGSENHFYDVQRVEVLRGPQGTLYGRNAIGGVINYITNPPTAEFFSEVRTRVGAHDIADLYAVVSGPIVRDKLAYRLVGVSVNQGADRNSRAAPGQKAIDDTGEFSDHNIGLTLEATPTDTIDIVIRGNTRYLRTTPRSPLLIGEGTGDRRQRSSAVCFPEGTDCFNDATLDFYVVPPLLNPNAHQSLPISGNGGGENLDNTAYPDFKPDYGYKYYSITTDAQWSLDYGRYTVRYLGGYSDIPWSTYDVNWGGAPGGRNTCAPPRCTAGPGGEQISAYRAYANNPLTQASHELQLITNWDGPLNLVGGLYYNNLERELYFELADDGQLGAYTALPSWGSVLDPSTFPPPLGPGRHNLGINDAAYIGLFGGTRRGSTYWYDSDLEVDARAVYVQANYAFSETWALTAGARWSRDEKHGREWRWFFSESNAEFFGFASLADFNVAMTTDPVTGDENGDPPRLVGLPFEIIDGIDIRRTWEQPTWRFALTFTPDRESMGYASITTGYRSGGFNLGLHQQFPYPAERVLAYEVGYKTDLFDDRLRVNTSIYHYAYDNHQISANQPIAASTFGCSIDCPEDPDTVITFFNGVQSVPEATNWGTEVEATWVATPLLTLGALHSYMRTEIDSDFFISLDGNVWADRLSTDIVNARGNELNRAPRHKFTLWANYTIPMGDQGRINLLGSYAYMGEQYQNVLNSRINQTPAFERWDARATWDSPTERYQLAAYVKNITNELGILEMRTANNFARIADTTAPRSWGIEFRMRFGSWDSGGVQVLEGPQAPNR